MRWNTLDHDLGFTHIAFLKLPRDETMFHHEGDIVAMRAGP
jgi:hypothetical protein